MSSARGSSRWQTTATGSMLLLILVFKATAVYSETITVQAGDKIQDALDVVQPGDIIEIESGDYYEDIETKVHGLPDERITVRAAGGSSNRENVVLRGAGGSRVFQIHHDYYTIEDFTIDGKRLQVEANDDNYAAAIRDKTLYVVGEEEPTMRDGGYLSAVDGLIVRFMTIKNAGGECIRLRYFVTYAEIYENELDTCGLHDWKYKDGGDVGKNGEGIYIGTSSKQWDDHKNPTDEPDVCLGNIVRHNNITTNGSEGVEVKEGSTDNIIEGNSITMQKDKDSGGIGSRGDGTIIRYNHIENAAGAGVRLGGHTEGGVIYGLNNQVYGNTMVDCMSYGVKVMEWPQGQICDNDVQLPDGKTDHDYDFTGGTYGHEFDPMEECTSNPTPSKPSPAPIQRSNPTPSPSTPSPETSRTPTPSTNSSPSPSIPTPTPRSNPPTPSTSSLTPAPGTPAPSTDPTPSPSTPASAPNTPAPIDDPESDVLYLGCFADERDSRTMNFGYTDTDGMSNQDCIEYCRSDGKIFAGTIRGTTCRCSNSSTKISRNGESTDCITPCTGDDSNMCGGWLSVSTWKIIQ